MKHGFHMKVGRTDKDTKRVGIQEPMKTSDKYQKKDVPGALKPNFTDMYDAASVVKAVNKIAKRV